MLSSEMSSSAATSLATTFPSERSRESNILRRSAASIHVPSYFCTIAHTLRHMSFESLMILIAGPYRSGTGDDPGLMAANLSRLEEAAWPLFAAGHVPMIGEWVALPVLRSAGADVSDPLANEVMYPTAQRVLQHCDAVLRLPGESTGADQ